MKHYKVLGPNRMPFHGGHGQWPPPGEWLKIEGALIPCQNGLHVLQRKDLLQWLGPEIWTIDIKGEKIRHEDNKTVVREASLVEQFTHWNERTARLFAADCAERVLPIFGKSYPNDNRPRNAIQAARDFANGKITAAAWDAARAAARAAAWAAAEAAARAAARAAAWAAERKWQTRRLFLYLTGKIK